MKSNYKRLGDYIHKVDERNKDYNTNLQGLSMTKEYRSSTSNIVGTDLSSYKVMRKNRFVCDFMSVIRVYKLLLFCISQMKLLLSHRHIQHLK